MSFWGKDQVLRLKISPFPSPCRKPVGFTIRRPGGELIPYVGETMLKLQEGFDLVINVAPEGCMVSSMGEVITPGIMAALPGVRGKVFPRVSPPGDIDAEEQAAAFLETFGPVRFYRHQLPEP